jgi:hypothetical protein
MAEGRSVGSGTEENETGRFHYKPLPSWPDAFRRFFLAARPCAVVIRGATVRKTMISDHGSTCH